MSEQTIQCPHCQEHFTPSASLLAPFLKNHQPNSEEREQLKLEQANLAKKEAELLEKERLAQQQQAKFEVEVQKGINAALPQVERDAQKQANELAEIKIKEEKKKTEILEQERTEIEKARKQNAQKEAELLEKERLAQQQQAKFEVEVQKRINAALPKIERDAQKQANELADNKLVEERRKHEELKLTIDNMKKKNTESIKTADSTSQQLQGEAQEVLIENMLRQKFPIDKVIPVEKGQSGADIEQKIYSTKTSKICGTILWESKNTKHFDEKWIEKFKADIRKNQSDIGVIVTKTMPNNVIDYKIYDEQIYVINVNVVEIFMSILRHQLVTIDENKALEKNRGTRAEATYEYLTNPNYERDLKKIFEIQNKSREKINKEKNFMNKNWSDREASINNEIEILSSMLSETEHLTGKNFSTIGSMIEEGN